MIGDGDHTSKIIYRRRSTVYILQSSGGGWTHVCHSIPYLTSMNGGTVHAAVMTVVSCQGTVLGTEETILGRSESSPRAVPSPSTGQRGVVTLVSTRNCLSTFLPRRRLRCRAQLLGCQNIYLVPHTCITALSQHSQTEAISL